MKQKILLLLAALGILDTLYLLLTAYGCSTCSTVHNTLWGRPFGFPLAAFGLLWYLLVFFSVYRKKAAMAFYLSSTGTAVSIGLVYLQAAVLKEFCVYCLFSAFLMTAIWALLLFNTPDIREEKQVIVPLVVLLFAGVLALYLLVPGQIEDGLKPGKIRQVAYSIHNSLTEITVREKSLRDDDLLLLYTAAGRPVEIKMSEKEIFFFASHCKACDRFLDSIAGLPEEQRPLLVDTEIHVLVDRETEIERVKDKFEPYDLDPASVLYDFDRIDPVNSVPAVVIKGQLQ